MRKPLGIAFCPFVRDKKMVAVGFAVRRYLVAGLVPDAVKDEEVIS